MHLCLKFFFCFGGIAYISCVRTYTVSYYLLFVCFLSFSHYININFHSPLLVFLALFFSHTLHLSYSFLALFFSHTLHLSYSFLNTAASDITGSTCIHRVAFLGLTEVGKLLLAGGCPIDAVNVEGDAATHIAAREVRTCRQCVLRDVCCIGWWTKWSLYQ
jgi:hypothetical protein